MGNRTDDPSLPALLDTYRGKKQARWNRVSDWVLRHTFPAGAGVAWAVVLERYRRLYLRWNDPMLVLAVVAVIVSLVPEAEGLFSFSPWRL